MQRFGGIDFLVNNASAIYLAGTVETPMKRFDLMHQVNARGTYLCCRACVPHLLKADEPHILNLSPPLNMETRWFEHHTAYSMVKFGMSMCELGMAGEFTGRIGVNALWPRTTIATDAVRDLLGGDQMVATSRKPAIMGDAAWAILTRDAATRGGHFFIDDEVMREEVVTDLDPYSVVPGSELTPDFFV